MNIGLTWLIILGVVLAATGHFFPAAMLVIGYLLGQK